VNTPTITARRLTLFALATLFFALTFSVRAQQQPAAPEDPEDEKQFGLWLDQGLSTPFSSNKSFDVELHERLDENAGRLFEYFVQTGVTFRLLPILSVAPFYRYQRFPGNPSVDYENRVLLNITLSKSKGSLRPNLRTLIEGRFPEGRVASARLRFRPGIEYTLPVRSTTPPVLIANNEFFYVPGTNSFAAGGSFTQNRVVFALLQPVNSWLALRPYYMIQSVNLPTGWQTNEIFGFSMAFKIPQKTTP
jgi:Protein of unknown function (DUF2490)